MALGRKHGGERRHRRLGRALLAVGIAAASLSVVATRAPAEAQNPSPLRRVGTLGIGLSQAMVADERTKSVLSLNEVTETVEAWDPVTLKRTSSLSMAPYDIPLQGTGVPQVHAFDPRPDRSRWYLLVYAAGGSATTRSEPLLAVIDPAGPRLESVKKIDPVLFPPGVVPQGMSYYAPTNRLYVLGASSNGLLGVHDVMLAEVDATTAKPTWSRSYALGALCQKTVNGSMQAAVHRPAGSSKVYFGCGTGSLVFSREPGLPGVVAVDISDPNNIRARGFPVSGSYAGGESVYDDRAKRLILASAGTGVPAQAAWVFDETEEVVVGVVGAGPLNLKGIGVDAVGGRLYVGIDNNLLVSTTRGLKIPQATEIPLPGIAAPTIVSVPFARRIIVNTFFGGKNERVVFESDLGDYVEPPVADPDAITSDIPEAPGSTAVTFGGDAKAFGARLHQVAGVNGMLQNVLALNNDYWANTGGRAGFNDGDRNVWFGRTTQARLGEGEASASAVGTDGDPNTQADYTVLADGDKWPYTPATCADLGNGVTSRPAPSATVECRIGAQVKAGAVHENSRELPAGGDRVEALASFGSAESSTTLERDPGLGLVVDTRAEARDVTLAGVARLGKVTSHARSAAKGRRGTASSSYERTFENVSMPGFSCSTDCDPVAVVEQLNRVLPGTIRAELPEVELVRTPRGAQASALRDPWHHQQDIVLNNEEETALEVPALRLVHYRDNAVRSRDIVEFAATMANSSYGVYSLAGAVDDDGGSFDSGSLAELVAGSSVLTDAVFTHTGAESGSGTQALGETAVVGSARSGRGNLLGRILRHGLTFLFTGRRALLLSALLWSLLSLPAFFAGRRRYLLRLLGSAS